MIARRRKWCCQRSCAGAGSITPCGIRRPPPTRQPPAAYQQRLPSVRQPACQLATWAPGGTRLWRSRPWTGCTASGSGPARSSCSGGCSLCVNTCVVSWCRQARLLDTAAPAPALLASLGMHVRHGCSCSAVLAATLPPAPTRRHTIAITPAAAGIAPRTALRSACWSCRSRSGTS